MSKLYSNCISLAVLARQKHGADKVRDILQALGYKSVTQITDAQDLIELQKRLNNLLWKNT
jgi:hypothetical protein